MMEPTAGSLANKIAVVTGSSSGIGRATALALAGAGAHVLVHAARNLSGAQETAATIQRLGRQATVLLADLQTHAQQDRFVEEAWAWRGRVDLLVNNAGADVLTGAAAKLGFEEKLELLWRVDVTATLRLSRQIGRQMRDAGGGVIINTSWDQAEYGMAGDSGELFAATKGAVAALTRSLARSLAPLVRVNAVAPGWIKTAWGETASAPWQTRAAAEALLNRWGTPEDVARATLYLCSPAAEFITGQVLPVNGGYRGAADFVETRD
ncbi:MAG: SDR family oxidoreductase [Pirellulales bacterium]|nr:SDR family oxidoreductase [Pirellulales bacterium]